MSSHLLTWMKGYVENYCYRSGSINADDVRAVCKEMEVNITKQELENLMEK